MDIVLIIIAVFAATLTGTVLAVFLIKKKSSEAGIGLDDKISKLSVEALRQNSEEFIKYAKEILNSQKNEIRIDLDGKKNSIEKLIDEIRKELKDGQQKLAKSEEDRVRSFSALENELKTYKEITGDLKVSTEKLKELLSNNQMRGAFGEQVADNLLKMAGFVVGQDYNRNEAQQTQNTRPDFTIFLPDQTKINIDVKFPYSSLVKYAEATEKTEKEMFLKKFKSDVKEKIKQVCTREYINPEEKTVDFLILFIPNEMIFSFIYDKMNDVWEEAMQKKVILAGPFSFTAILRMIKQAYANFRYQENLHQIISLIHRFDKEYDKYNEEVTRLGDRIDSVAKQYSVVSTTRDRQLSGIVEKIKSQNIKGSDNTELIE